MSIPSRFVLTIACSLATHICAQEEPAKDPDLLRFENGDVLHGRFEGMENGTSVTWSGNSIKSSINLQSGTLRRIALNGGRAAKSLPQPEFVQLVNGDQIPGRVIELDDKNLTLETPMAGTVVVERQFVSSISPNPFGGSLHYIGPFTKDEWSFVERPKAESQPRSRRVEEPEEDEDPWAFGGDAWYSNGQVPIAVDANIPDKARIKFNLAWRSRLSAVVAFHASLDIPQIKKPEEEEDGDNKKVIRKKGLPSSGSNSYPLTYGHSYVLTIYSSYAMLYRCDFDKDGNPKMNRLTNSSATIRLEESGEAEFELRCDRENSRILLFVNDEYVNQWEDPQGYAGIGSHLTFGCQNAGSHLRVSDIVVSNWNGMLDSARSMDAEDRDTILLNNGTDRFSGKITGIKSGHYQLKGTYADMQIPVDEVEELRFARSSRKELPAPSGKALRLILRPIGRITLDPGKSTPTDLTGRHQALGDINLDLGFASIIEFSFSDSILDSWDEKF